MLLLLFQESYKLLNVPVNADQETIHHAFIQLAKKYHPDSGSPDANIDKFVDVENAFRILSKCNNGSKLSTEEVERIVYDIRVSCSKFSYSELWYYHH